MSDDCTVPTAHHGLLTLHKAFCFTNISFQEAVLCPSLLQNNQNKITFGGIWLGSNQIQGMNGVCDTQ